MRQWYWLIQFMIKIKTIIAISDEEYYEAEYINLFLKVLKSKSFLKSWEFKFSIWNVRVFKAFSECIFFFFFMSLKSFFLKYKKNMWLESSISGNIRNILILHTESSILWNARNFVRIDFFYFLELVLKSAAGSPIYLLTCPKSR